MSDTIFVIIFTIIGCCILGVGVGLGIAIYLPEKEYRKLRGE